MAHDDRLIVLGDGSHATDLPDLSEPPRSPLWILFPVAGLFVALIAFVVVPQDEPVTRTDPGGLEAPDEPPAPAPDPTTTPAPDGLLAAGVVDLVGPGTVTSVAHGPEGWLAVSAGPPVVAHRSDDGTVWQPSTIHGMVGADPVAAVGSGVLAVVGSNHLAGTDVPRPVGAVSSDGGATWSLIEHSGRMVVRDVGIVDGRIFVGGAVGQVLGFGWDDRGSAALWEVVDARLVDVPLSSAPAPGEVRSIVETDGGVIAYGFTAEGPAAWNLQGALQALSLPSTGPFQRFVTVKNTGDGLVGLIGRADASGGTSVWASHDGHSWTDPGRAPWISVTDLDVTDAGEIVAPLAAEYGIWSEERGIVRLEPPQDASISGSRLTEVTATDDMVVFAGGTVDGPVLVVQGSSDRPVEVAAPLADHEGRWRPQLTIDLGLVGLGGTAWPMGSFADDRAVYLLTTTNVYEIDISQPGLLVTPTFERPYTGGTSPAGTWIASVDQSDSLKLHLRNDAGWTTQDVPLEGVAAVGLLGDTTVMTGWGVSGYELFELTADGHWSPLGPSRSEEMFLPVGHGMVGLGEWIGEIDAPQATYSRNGFDWGPIEGWSLRVGLQSMLRSVEDPSIVAYPETAPTPQAIRLPTDALDIAILRWDDRLVVQDPWTLFVQDASGDWTALPIDQEHGVTGPAVPIPGPTPRLAMIDRGLLTFLVWR